MIKLNTPACPAGCVYCMVNYIPTRYQEWSKGKIYGINKTLTFINPNSLDEVDFSLLEYEFVGYQGTNDPFNPIYRNDLEKLVDITHKSNIKKLVLVTKLGSKNIKFLQGTDKVQMVVSITGLQKPIERVSIEERIEFVYRLVDIKLTPLVFIHPYIHTLSDLSFLDKLRDIKDKIVISYKGFRYNKAMTWLKDMISKEILDMYEANENEEVMIGEEYVKEKLKGFTVSPFRRFIHYHKTPMLYQEVEEAVKAVDTILSMATISSSDASKVREFAIKRRCYI